MIFNKTKVNNNMPNLLHNQIFINRNSIDF